MAAGGRGGQGWSDGRAHAQYDKCVGEPRGATCGVLLAACRFTCPPTSPLVPVEVRYTASTVSGRVELEVDTPLPTCPKQLTQQFAGRHQMGAISGAGTSGFRLQTPPRPRPSKPRLRVLEAHKAAAVPVGILTTCTSCH